VKYEIIIDKNAEEKITAVVHKPSELTKQIENLVIKFSGESSITAYNDEEMLNLSFDEIECITIISRKLIAIDKSGNQYRIQGTLREIEDTFPSYFIRINKSTLANEHHIQKFKASISGGVDAIFKCGYREYVSRRCFAQIRRRYEK